MRNAVFEAFHRLTGTHAEFCFSGWGGKLDEIERAVVENRAPNFDAVQTLTVKIDTSAIQAEIDKAVAEFEAYRDEHRRLVRELDVALNGEVGAAQQASLCDLVAQVRRQQSVQILNLNSGFRLNFRAPSGRRGTLRLDTLLDALGEDAEIFEPGIADVARAAMDAYPVAGEPLPLDVDQQTAAQVQALGHQIHPDMARPSVRCEDAA